MICGAFQQGCLRLPNLWRPGFWAPAAPATTSGVRNSKSRVTGAMQRAALAKRCFENRDPCNTRRRTLCFATCRFALHSADTCATTGCAVTTIIRTADAQGRRVDCERLLLPLGQGEGRAPRRLAAADRPRRGVPGDTVLDAFDANISVAFAVVIAGVGAAERRLRTNGR
jgi:hypothetical protein